MYVVKIENVFVDVELEYKGKRISKKALVDTGASKSIISRKLAVELGALIPLDEPYELRTANKNGRLYIIGFARLRIKFQGVTIPGGCTFEVADNLREDIDVIIGRPEIDSWGIIFTPEGAKLRKVPVEFDVV